MNENNELTRIERVNGRYTQMLHLYDAAIREVRTRIEILDGEHRVKCGKPLIHQVFSRVKSGPSIVGKLERKGLPISVESAEEHLTDIAGVRVVCEYTEDIYRVANMLTRQHDLEQVRMKDYIREPKENGYRSLHLILRVPVFLSGHTELIPVEIQLRTIAMDFWASLEHELRYKSGREADAQLKARLKRCAEQSAALDAEMQNIRNELRSPVTVYARTDDVQIQTSSERV